MHESINVFTFAFGVLLVAFIVVFVLDDNGNTFFILKSAILILSYILLAFNSFFVFQTLKAKIFLDYDEFKSQSSNTMFAADIVQIVVFAYFIVNVQSKFLIQYN